ncbi:non-ribosomal peptide synthetase [Enterovibrio norvegicus FF-33]|uniref:non-ribosomal peptide synthetase n=1 Tax=Enterovibrio norvegicus TaxID=188144 RepID=UPI0002D55FD2|nr:non-ribosomal peptide synthetase [Enterovibrio norvegicus]OEE65935.1 non-ribosomal peptide synthetase [Enterovibrio norvegicus FF-33]
MSGIDKSNVSAILPLLPLQEGMLFHHIAEPDSQLYFEQIRLNISGVLDTRTLQSAWDKVVMNNDALRTVFRWKGIDNPVQVVLKKRELNLDVYDSTLDHPSLLSTLRSPNNICLESTPIQLSVLKHSESSYTIILCFHHIILDGWSSALLLKSLLDVYKTPDATMPLTASTSEIVEGWKKTDSDKATTWWREAVTSAEVNRPLPRSTELTDESKAVQITENKTVLTLPQNTLEAIKTFSEKQSVSAATIFHAVFALTLRFYQNQKNLTFATTVSGRHLSVPHISHTAGLFINTVPFCASLNLEQSFNDWAHHVQGYLADINEHGAFALKDIHGLTSLPQEARMFDSLLVVENYPLDTTIAQGTGFTINTLETDEETDFDLTLAITQLEGFECNLITKKGRFESSFSHSFLAHFSSILERSLQISTAPMKSLSLLSVQPYTLAPSKPEYKKDLISLFKQTVLRFPEKSAVSSNDTSLTYQKLDNISDQIAASLANKGVEKGSIVALRTPQNIDMICAIFGILKAGATYLPLLPDLPAKRSEFMLEDTSAHCCITSDEDKYTSAIPTYKISELIDGSQPAPSLDLNINDIAYIIYSSGSTGIPKGICTPHGAVSSFVTSPTYVDISHDDKVLQLSSYGFDGSIFDIFTTLCNGAELVLVDKETQEDLTALSRHIETAEISVFFVTTALFNALVDVNLSALSQVRKILFGGEKVSVPHVRKAFRSMGPGRLVHVYGPTETTVFATAYAVDTSAQTAGTFPIGKAINTTEAYVIDIDGLPCLPGVPGELYIGGDALAKGYLNRPDLTSRQFIVLPGYQGRLYRTGDEVIASPDSTLTYVCRLDAQVKIRGLRIELGEIHTHLIDITGASEAFVSVVGNDEGNGSIIAYLCQSELSDQNAISQKLAEFLPRYMLPQSYFHLDRLPLTANNKVDIEALPTPNTEQKTSRAQPASATEEKMLEIWKRILAQPNLSVNDDLFRFGANSLAISRASAQIQKHLSKHLDIKTLFATPTVREQSRLLDKKADESDVSDIQPANDLTAFPATPMQEGLFTQSQMLPESTAYNMPLALRLSGNVSPDHIEQSFKGVMKRHPILCSRFKYNASTLFQEVVEPTVHAEWFDSGTLLSDCWRSFVRPFDLTTGPLFRLGIIPEQTSHILLLDIHHIASDGVSLIIILNELLKVLSGEDEQLATPEVCFGDYAHWLTTESQQNKLKEQAEFWEKEIKSLPPRLDFITDHPRPETPSFKGAQVRISLGNTVSNEIDELANASFSANTILFTAFHLVLAKYSQQIEFSSSILCAGRTQHQTENMVGMFNNFLPIAFHCEPNQSIQELLCAQHTRLISVLNNQSYPFHEMVNQWADQEPGRNPIFDSMFIFHNQFAQAETIALNGLTLENLNVPSNNAKLDIKLDIYPSVDNGYQAIFEFSTDLFEIQTIEVMANHFEHVVRNMLANPLTLVNDIALTTTDESNYILSEFNDTQTASSSLLSLKERFEDLVEAQPGAIAISSKDSALTWAAFNRKVNRMAHYLIESGVGPESIVAIQMPRSIDMMVTLFAITKAGGAWLPISVDNPEKRTHYILEDCGASLHLHGEKPANNALCQSVDVTTLDTSRYSTDNPKTAHSPTNLAYVIYTSGSTGEPKGVLIEHHSLVNRLEWMQKKYPLFKSDIVLQKTPYTFDVSVWELIWWSFTGASLHLLGHGEEKEPSKILSVVGEQGITCMHFVPSMLSAFLTALTPKDAKNMKNLKQVFASGEALTYQQACMFQTQLQETNGTKLHNLYGPTEATIDVSYFDCSVANLPNPIPIGKPIDNTTLLILDLHGQPCPIGIAGELFIGGVNLARGYLNKKKLTAERFINNPFGEGRLYKTGDKARWKRCGNIEYLGRLDQQIKIRGQRIETGEIEHELAKVTSACHVGTYLDNNDEISLAAWVVPIDEENDHICAQLRQHVLDALPSYMVPSIFVLMKDMPLTANGKLDRNALPKPEAKTRYSAPQNDTELRLANIVEGILKRDNVSRDDNFFLIGGHSLSATRLMANVREQWKVDLPLRDIFASPLIKELALIISNSAPSAYSNPVTKTENTHKPLSFGQHRMWLIDKIDHTKGRYNIHTNLHIQGSIDYLALEKAINITIMRHEIIRTTYSSDGHSVSTSVSQNVDLDIVHFDHQELSITEKESALASLTQEMSHFPFDLSKDLLLRAHLIKQDANNHILLLTMHHIASDGWSLAVLTHELSTLYRDLTSGNSPSLPPMDIQYSDYATWQRDFEKTDAFQQQKLFWTSALEGLPECHQLPLDCHRPAIQSYKGARTTQYLSPSLTSALKSLSMETGTTLFMVFQTAFSLFLSKYSNESDIVMGTPIANREQPGIDSLIGFFVNTLIVRSNINQSDSFENQLQQNRSHLLAAYAHQQYPFEQLVEALSPTRNLSHHPLFQIMLVMQNQDISIPTIAGLEIKPLDVTPTTAKFDLLLDIAETEDSLRLHWDFDADLFTHETLQQMTTRFENLLHSIVAHREKPQCLLSLISQEEQIEIAHEARSSTVLSHLSTDTIVTRFEAMALRYPENTAISYQGNEWNYQSLNERANRLAHLLKARGAKEEVKIVLVAEPCFEMLVAILAILKTGAAYVPVDPNSPQKRVQHILYDCGATILVTATSHDVLPAESGALNLFSENTQLALQSQPTTFCSQVSHDNLAYIIYTSGSTGIPKGVQVEHRQVVRLFDTTEAKFGFTDDDVWTLFHSFAFDFSVWEIWGALLHGGKLVVVPPLVARSPNDFCQLLSKEKVTVLNQTPSAFYQLSEMEKKTNHPLTLRYVIFGGEALTFSALQSWIERHPLNQTALINMYGITETTVHVTYKSLTASDIHNAHRSLIGQPIDDLYIYIMGEANTIQPVGIAGEMYIGGAGITRGYLNRDSLNRERFVEDSFSPEQTLYRSGDIARKLPNGEIEYLGRGDEQVKVRGFRIELGEIEHQLQAIDDISEAVVVPHGQSLAAFVVSSSSRTLNEYRALLEQHLPNYMIPCSVTEIDHIPLTTNGKTNREELLNRQAPVMTGSKHTNAQTDTERKLLDIWETLLGATRISVTDNFFDIGANSLLIVQAHAKIESTFAGSIRVTDLFNHTTIRKLGQLIDANNTHIQIQPTRLPDSFFSPRTGRSMVTLKASYDIHTWAKFIAAMQRCDTPVLHGQVAIFAYLIAQVNKCHDVNFTFAAKDGLISPFSIDLSNAKSISEMVASTQATLVDAEKSPNISTSGHIDNKHTQIIVRSQEDSLKQDVEQHFDLMLSLPEGGGANELRLHVNTGTLRKDQINTLLAMYLKLFAYVTHELTE